MSNCIALVNRCPKLFAPSYGSVSVTGLEVGSAAKYQCDAGFTLVGSSTRYCLPSGEWSLEAPVCNCELLTIHFNIVLLILFF